MHESAWGTTGLLVLVGEAVAEAESIADEAALELVLARVPRNLAVQTEPLSVKSPRANLG